MCFLHPATHEEPHEGVEAENLAGAADVLGEGVAEGLVEADVARGDCWMANTDDW